MSIETSAKAGHNVKALFKKIAMALPGGAEAKDAAANQSEYSISPDSECAADHHQRSTSARPARSRPKLQDAIADNLDSFHVVMSL